MQWEGIYEEMLIMKIIYVGEDGGERGGGALYAQLGILEF